MRPTNFSTCKETVVPSLGTKGQEQSLQDLKSEIMNITKKYVTTKCDSRGFPNKDPIPKEIHQGIKELDQVVSGGTHVYFQTDKSGKGSLNSTENYFSSAAKHTTGDPVVGPEVVKANERVLNSHSWQLGRALGLGSTTSKPASARIKGAITNTNVAPPKMYCAPKDHKPLVAGEENLGPPGRPICGAREAPNGQLSVILSQVINSLCDIEKTAIMTESGSTEDVLAAIDSANTNATTNNNWILGSMDVAALYPSLEAEEDSVVVGKLVSKYCDKVQGVVWPEVSRYLVLTHTPAELKSLGLTGVCHTRKFSRGNDPGITTDEVKTPLGDMILDAESKFDPPQAGANRTTESYHARGNVCHCHKSGNENTHLLL